MRFKHPFPVVKRPSRISPKETGMPRSSFNSNQSRSTGAFFGEIGGGKQLGDSLSTPTVPLLPHL
jgi:hypothetical protein